MLDRNDLAKAMQEAWNEFVADTGCFPDCFEWRGGNGVLFANFARGNFVQWVADRYPQSDAADQQSERTVRGGA